MRSDFIPDAGLIGSHRSNKAFLLVLSSMSGTISGVLLLGSAQFFF
jgi:hypothetical protein